MLATECELLSGSVKGYWFNLYRCGHLLFFRLHQFIRHSSSKEHRQHKSLHLKWNLSVPFSRFLSVQLRTDVALKNNFFYQQLKCSLALACLLGLGVEVSWLWEIEQQWDDSFPDSRANRSGISLGYWCWCWCRLCYYLWYSLVKIQACFEWMFTDLRAGLAWAFWVGLLGF